ncbi:hypothetical protein OHA21_12140 [Actinoplanes sp. NBC_00393]|uniref:RipA family octameric membrane protein n=1 Tax=Actinoplanes sp. NBC_00393 TaxID=2975953 RepID=UPI002E1F5F83
MNLARYLRPTTVAIDDVRPALWTGAGDAQPQPTAEGSHPAVLLEQYKIYVEMADRVSARRGLTNTFFLTLNTIIVTAFGTLWKDEPRASTWFLAIPAVALLLQCVAWFWILSSYRQLNSAKYIVIGALEERLPASPYWRAEWTALGRGKDPSRYWPLTHLEQWIPVSFAVVYIGAFIVVVSA